jgi:hypothetical protein
VEPPKSSALMWISLIAVCFLAYLPSVDNFFIPMISPC